MADDPVSAAGAVVAEPAAEHAAPEEQGVADTDKANGSEVKDAEHMETAEPEAGADANGTPASAKKAASSARRKSGGVSSAESKNKLGRKKSQPRLTNLHAKPGELYTARLRSFPPWPAVICDEEMLPQSMLSTRPVTAMRPDGSYRDDYADGGKRAHERTFPVMFLHTNEFAWIPNTDLAPLDVESCKTVAEKGKSKTLLAAYAVAAENHDLDHYKSMLADHQRALEQEQAEIEAEQAAKAAAKAEKEAKMKKRAADVEMADADEAEKKPKASKKRKQDSDMDADAEKAPASGDSKKTPGSGRKQAGSAKKSAKAAAAVSDEGEDEDTAPETKESAKTPDPKEMKEKREREILYIRHKLQKGFLTRDQPPQEDEMPTFSNYFTRLETYSDLEVSIIRSTKINKVLKMILKLSSIPREEEFNFRGRAMDILSKWKPVLDSDTTPAPADKKDKQPDSAPAAGADAGAAAGAAEGDGDAAKPTANGAAHADKDDGEGDDGEMDGPEQPETPTKADGAGKEAETRLTDEPMLDADPEAGKTATDDTAEKTQPAELAESAAADVQGGEAADKDADMSVSA